MFDPQNFIKNLNLRSPLQDNASGLVVSPSRFHKRPRKVISDDGDEFINLWFIPHYTEVLSLHRYLDEKVLCAHAQYFRLCLELHCGNLGFVTLKELARELARMVVILPDLLL